jgi:formate hydrogenlyase transcriptional activator
MKASHLPRENNSLVGAIDDEASIRESLSLLLRAAGRKVQAFSSAGTNGASRSEVRRRERLNLFAALQKTGWKIKGVDGAGELLGLKPATLISRIEKMGLQRPNGKNAFCCAQTNHSLFI